MLTRKEQFLVLADEHGLTVYDKLPSEYPINGLYIEKGERKIILMKASLPDSKYIPVLIEEIGHYVASQGVVVELDGVDCIKSENYGRSWAIEYLLPICKFTFASVLFGCQTSADYAEAFSLDEEFVKDAIEYHKQKGNWMNSFETFFQLLAKPNYREILRRNKMKSKDGLF